MWTEGQTIIWSPVREHLKIFIKNASEKHKIAHSPGYFSYSPGFNLSVTTEQGYLVPVMVSVLIRDLS